MAKKVTGYIKLQIPAGKATPAPPVGPALGQHGVNIVEFTKQFNARTADKGDLIIPVVITVYADRSFSFITKTPPAELSATSQRNEIPLISVSLSAYHITKCFQAQHNIRIFAELSPPKLLFICCYPQIPLICSSRWSKI